MFDKAQLTLTAPEMTVLVGGMRVLNTILISLKMEFLQTSRSTLLMISL
jgi:catalase (peroxidase I)